MPPESHFHSFASPVVMFSPLSSPETLFIFSLGLKSRKENHSMKIPPSSTASNPNLQHKCNSTFRKCRVSSFDEQSKSTALTKKEFDFLSNLIKSKAPCNLLVFGLELQYLKLTSINSGGISVFLEDDIETIRKIRVKSNNTRIYKVDYHVPVKEAYELLKHARKNSSCALSSIWVQNSACKLALTNLREEIYEQKWDVIAVDGLSGDSLEAPGRMAAIYTAAVMARCGNKTDVFMHDVNRTVEKWFSWEFLCEQNLAPSKGMFWKFWITSTLNSTKFCTG